MSVWLFLRCYFCIENKSFKGEVYEKGKTTVASLLIVLVTLGLDQWTKWAVEKSIALNDSVEMINHFFYLTYVRNTGAGFSMFAEAGMGFFAALTIIALVGMVYMFLKRMIRVIRFVYL